MAARGPGEVGQVVGQDIQPRPNRFGTKDAAGQWCPINRVLALLEVPLRRVALMNKATARSGCRDRLLTMIPAGGNSSPEYHATMAMTRCFLFPRLAR